MSAGRQGNLRFRKTDTVFALLGLGLLLAISAFAATRSQAAPQGPWVLPATDLSETGEDANGLATAVGSDGTTAVVWPRGVFPERPLAVRIRPPVGEFGPPIEIPGTEEGPDDEAVAVGPDGSVTVAWARAGVDNQQIQTATLSPGGSSFSPAENLSTDAYDAESPRVVIGPDGTTTVAWERGTGSGDVAESSTRPPDGDFSPAEVLSGAGTSLSSVVPAAGPGGAATVTWVALSGPDYRVHAATRPAGGSFGTPELLSPAASEAIDSDVATGPDGTTIVVWALRDGSDEIIQASIRPAGGAFSAASDLSDPAASVRDPRIAIGSDGTAAAAWFLQVAPFSYQVQASIRPDGGAFEDPVDISDPDSEINKTVNVAVAPDSTVTLLWREETDTEPVVAAATKAPGAGFTEPQFLSSAGFNAESPELTVGPDGKATAAWRLNNGSDQIVQAASTETPTYNVKLTRKGPGKGKVTSSPGGITCGNDCSGDFTSLTTITLTASPDPGERFTGWTGPCTGTALTCEVFMDRDRTPSATFCPKKSLKLGKLTRNKKNGTAKLAVTAGGSGTVVLKSSKKVKKKTRKVGSKGTGSVSIKAKGKSLKTLKKKGNVKVKLTTVYKPGGGCSTVTKKRTVKLIRK